MEHETHGRGFASFTIQAACDEPGCVESMSRVRDQAAELERLIGGAVLQRVSLLCRLGVALRQE